LISNALDVRGHLFFAPPSVKVRKENKITFPDHAESFYNSSMPSKRQYPDFYEKAVPIAIGIIGVVVIILILIILGVALGLFANI
jgi:hypothetical protein